ncbi:cyclase family protein [Arthrobacter mobilis]|uniref:Cyclase family protein n=1 Tax=Arthrobacter mobilis TaxID=2724944 RepID=A0A7X6K6R1_9MICC|nr:cyclase family protein [Arthrobacter mobilis]NKX55388.1 cyclase family protein [Arthrobacter mobilis]
MALHNQRDLHQASAEALRQALSAYRIIDLSRELIQGIPAIPTHPKFFLLPFPAMTDPAEFNQLVMSDHSGTHVDVPAHFVPDPGDKRRVHTHEISLTALMGRAVKLSFGPYEPDSHNIGPDEIIEWEAQNTAIERDDIVLFDTKWGHRWSLVPEGFDYLNGWPGLTGEAAIYLRGKGVKAVGIDCISIDPGDKSGPDLRAHYELLPAGVLVMENLCNLAEVPEISYFMAFPLRLSGGTGSPIRAISLVPNSGGNQ